MSARVTPISIRVATTLDAAALSEFAKQTFVETFGADNSPADMTAYVDATFAPGLQAAELADSEQVILLGTPSDRGEELIAYAHLGMEGGAAPSVVTSASSLELKRFYVASQWHGRGVAQALMQRVLTAASESGGRTLWLGVWERNARAIAFYRKCGFEHVGEQPFRLGADVQTDWIMQRSLDAPPQ